MSKEKVLHVASGWGMLAVVLLMFAGSIACFVLSLISMIQADESALPVPALAVLGLIVSVLIFIVAIIVSNGFFSLQPGQARICVLFGQYQGTVRDEGLRWANPFFSKNLGAVLGKSSSSLKVGEEGVSFDTSKPTSATISLRARTHDGERIKVNDKMGNPIEIATVVVWHVADTAKAAFDVDNYESYVSMQT
ncbi:SPFH domain-containing protein, partial [uncultured Olegusella sp.]|uniref:SPFH domain-containing protein n=1 Tax=uncultured Olegusella sp. TaxID=1979846 RepID=UPI0026187AFE